MGNVTVSQGGPTTIVLSRNVVANIQSMPRSVDVGKMGLQGPPGPPGPDGGDAHFRFVQSVAASTWTVQHNLNKRPSVTIVDSAGNLVIGDVQYDAIDPLNKLTVTFSTNFSGEVECN